MSQRGACADYGEFPRAKAIPNAFVRVSELPGSLFILGMANFRELGLFLTETVYSSESFFVPLSKTLDESCEMGPIPFLTSCLCPRLSAT